MSIRDISSPEAIATAEEFTRQIKDGTIKNPHTRIYRGECDDIDITTQYVNNNTFIYKNETNKKISILLIFKFIHKICQI